MVEKKLFLVAGVAGAAGLMYASQSGLLEDYLPDEFDEEDEDPQNLNINNPLALLAIEMATRAGLKAAGKAVKKVATKLSPPSTKIPPKVPGADSVKPAVPSKTPVVVEPPKPPPPKASGISAPKPGAAPEVANPKPPPPKPPVNAAAKSASKASNASKMLGKLKGTPADLIMMIIAQVLMAVLDLDPSKFKACETGEFDLGALPDWANAMIGAIPFLGDLFDLIGNKMCLKAGCPKDAPDESAGLCYKPCDPGFKSDGAIMCYKQYPEFESNGMGHTITSITKKILMDTGKIPSRCADGEDKSGALCYEHLEGFTNVAGVAWQNCPAGFTDTGVRCEKNQDVGAGRIPALNPCPAGMRDDGVSCWDDLKCRTWSDPIQCGGDAWRPVWDPNHWRCWGGDVHTSCTGTGGIAVNAFQRGQKTEPWEEKIDGLNYNRCPEGMWHIPGMPYLCSASFTKQSRVMSPKELKCPRTAKAGVAAGQVDWEEETNISGLCYSKVPTGYTRKVLGTLDQDCPPGSTDFGVGCTRQAYSRGAGLIPLGIRFKDRNPS